MTAEIAKIIDDGLRWYEEELWHDRPKPTMEKAVNLISQETIRTTKTSANEEEGNNQSERSQGKSLI
jgi:hypothetical protein